MTGDYLIAAVSAICNARRDAIRDVRGLGLFLGFDLPRRAPRRPSWSIG